MVHVATDHQRNDLIIGNVVDIAGTNIAAVTQHGIVIGNFPDFFQKVADVDNSNPLFFQLVNDVE